MSSISAVDYLVLGERPHLVAQECVGCGSRYFDRRVACAGCFGVSFRPVDVATEGVLRTFTVVHVAAPGVQVPFTAGVVDCDGTSVRTNVTGVEPSPAAVRLGMRLRLVTVPVGTDDEGTEAIGFAFAPLPDGA